MVQNTLMHYTVAHSISPTSISSLDEAANGEEGEVPAATTVGWESPNDQPADEWGGWLAYDGQSWFFFERMPTDEQGGGWCIEVCI